MTAPVSGTELSDTRKPLKPSHIIAAASVGNALEWYDIAVYSFFAVYIAKEFFPNHDPSVCQKISGGVHVVKGAQVFRARRVFLRDEHFHRPTGRHFDPGPTGSHVIPYGRIRRLLGCVFFNEPDEAPAGRVTLFPRRRVGSDQIDILTGSRRGPQPGTEGHRP